MKASSPDHDTESPSVDATAVSVRMLLSEKEAAFLWGMSERKFADLCKEPWMPKPLELGPRLLRWSRAELDAAVANMPRKSARTVPTELAARRVWERVHGPVPEGHTVVFRPGMRTTANAEITVDRLECIVRGDAAAEAHKEGGSQPKPRPHTRTKPAENSERPHASGDRAPSHTPRR